VGRGRALRRGDVGASAVEYGLIVFAIAAVVAIAVAALGSSTLGLFEHSCAAVNGINNAENGHQPESC
jgi:Flp pilus assembly pilin Flp